MFVELLHPTARAAMFEAHRNMTVQALVAIFDWKADGATGAVSELWKRYAEASTATRERLVHEDPVNLAAEIAKTSPDDLLKEPFAGRVSRYNAEIRPAFEKARAGIAPNPGP
jgi:hypothetical protein